MCNENLINIVDLDFTSIDDSLNWSATGNNQVAQWLGLLQLRPATTPATFSRTIGNAILNNRLEVNLNLKVRRNLSNASKASKMLFQIYSNGAVLAESEIAFTGLLEDRNYYYFLKRTYAIPPIVNSQVTFKIIVTEGDGNYVDLENLKNK